MRQPSFEGREQGSGCLLYGGLPPRGAGAGLAGLIGQHRQAWGLRTEGSEPPTGSCGFPVVLWSCLANSEDRLPIDGLPPPRSYGAAYR